MTVDTRRGVLLARLRDEREPWDFAIVGGGATGVGVALDAASRGFRVVLLERADFGAGTSSRSTKLIHGGVRYLAQGNLRLVREALRERGYLARNAPHLVHSRGFLVPAYRWWEKSWYGVGLGVYDWLAGRQAFAPSRRLGAAEALAAAPTLRTDRLRGGVLYEDGQFDDSRLLVAMVRTAAAHGALLVNYCPVVGLQPRGVDGWAHLQAKDALTKEEFSLRARVVVNCAGPFSDAVRTLAEPKAPPHLRPSQGAHVVLPGRFLPGKTAVLVPRTPDGRVLFLIPWHGQVLVGTTDTPLEQSLAEPTPLPAEVDFILETANRYLATPAAVDDLLSVFAGIRPLVGSHRGRTSSLSRSHSLIIEPNGLVTLAGGKWTTWRWMAEQAVDAVCPAFGLPKKPCRTRDLPLHGFQTGTDPEAWRSVYGSDGPALEALARQEPGWDKALHPELPYRAAEVLWAARHEQALRVEDVLARRLRALFQNARAALEIAPTVAELLARELGRDVGWQKRELADFAELAAGYQAQRRSPAGAGSREAPVDVASRKAR